MKKLLLLLSLTLVHLSVSAQEAEQEFKTERPNKTLTSSLVPAGHFQLETGLQVEKVDFAFIEGREWLYPQAALRIGAFSVAELRVEGTYRLQQSFVDDVFVGEYKGLSTVRVGTKVSILKEKGLLPEMSGLVMLELPLGKEGFKPDKVLPELRLLFTNSLSERITLQYNIGYRKEPVQENTEEKVLFSASLNGKLTNRISLFGEYFVERTNTSFENNIDGGLQFLVLPNLQVDAVVGTDVASEFSNWFVGGGLSIRLPR